MEILQARILEWVAFPFSRESSLPRDRTQVSCLAGRFFTSWATREAPTWKLVAFKPWHSALSSRDTVSVLYSGNFDPSSFSQLWCSGGHVRVFTFGSHIWLMTVSVIRLKPMFMLRKLRSIFLSPFEGRVTKKRKKKYLLICLSQKTWKIHKNHSELCHSEITTSNLTYFIYVYVYMCLDYIHVHVHI